MGAIDTFIRAISEAIQPDGKIAIDEWAEQYRYLPPDSPEPGKWRNARTPYLVDIMRTMSPGSLYREGYLMKGHQLGGSAAGENFIGHAITCAAGNILAVFATLEDAEKWNLSRFEPMREATPELRRRIRDPDQKGANNTQRRKKFPGGFMQLIGANRPGGLKSSTMRYVLLEEMDEYAGDIGNQGKPEDLAKKRTSNFGRKAKIFGNSTPTVAGASAIERNYDRGDKRRLMIPCPHCGHRQYFDWRRGMKWVNDDPETVRYACSACGVLGSETEWKVGGLDKAEWMATAKGEPGVASWHLPSLYAPLGWRPWTVLVHEWLVAQKDPVALKAFLNNELAECWEDQSSKLKGKEIKKRAEDYALRTVPKGALRLSMSVDVQGNRIEYEIAGWGRRQTSWVIDYAMIDGDPSQDGPGSVWERLDKVRRTPILNSYGVPMMVEACAIDTGYFAQAVYNYCSTRQTEGVFAIKSYSEKHKPIIGRGTPQDVTWRGRIKRGGVLLWMIGADTAKEIIFARLGADGEEQRKPEDRLIRFSRELPDEYYDQLTAEYYDEKRDQWNKVRARNEALDLKVYNLVAAHHPRMRIHAMHDADWQRYEDAVQPLNGDLFKAPAASAAGQAETPAPPAARVNVAPDPMTAALLAQLAPAAGIAGTATQPHDSWM